MSSVVFLYDSQVRILDKISALAGIKSIKPDQYKISKADSRWAKEILNGGYILHFKHAEREKWIDVQMYDAIESNHQDNGKDGSRYAERDYFLKAVCLSDRGKIQAKAMGEVIKHDGLPFSHVATYVSCRARQAADLALDGFDTQHRLLVRRGPYNEKKLDRVRNLREFYTTLPMKPNSNLIVSAHNSVIMMDMFENPPASLKLEEGGFL